MCFRNYGLPKTWLDQCVKIPVSEDPSKTHMVNAPKRSSNLIDSAFTIFPDYWEVNCPTKSLC